MNERTQAVTDSIDVIVVTYQSEDWIDSCLSSIPDRVGDLPVRKLVVDSASTDATVECALGREDVDLLALPENRGFAFAVNRGMARSNGRFAVLLNPDAMLGVDALEMLIDRLERDPGLGAVAPEIIDQRGELHPSGQGRPTLGGELARTFERIAKPVGLRRPDELGEDEDPAWVSGACLAMSREAWNRVGPFDAGYFLYFEETDWCLRAASKGYRFAVEGRALAVHVGGASSDENNASRRAARRLFRTSRRRFFRRHHGVLAALGVDLLHGARALVDRGSATESPA